MKLLKIFYSVLKNNLINEFQYKTQLYMKIINITLDVALAVITVLIMFGKTGRLNTWKQEEVLILIGVYRIMVGLLNLFIKPSLASFTGSIKSGDFDYTLLLPVDAQFMSCIKTINIFNLAEIVFGIFYLMVLKTLFALHFDALGILGFGITLVAGFITIVCLYSLVASLSFWFLDSSHLLIIFPQCIEWTGKWPISAFPEFFRIVFTYIVPVGLAITIPAEALLHKLELKSLGITVLISLILMVVSRVVWKLGIKKYSGASA
ncbi:MAG TPA: ABC-2 family transporter protein [Bacillota bacterium]|nr:ABC-2 family transporter protein [Bacillota bacterium]